MGGIISAHHSLRRTTIDRSFDDGMVHQVDDGNKEPYSGVFNQHQTCTVTDHQTHLLLKIIKLLSGACLAEYRLRQTPGLLVNIIR